MYKVYTQCEIYATVLHFKLYTANKYYNAETFRMPSSDALESIKGWVSEKTHEKIDQIMSEDEFNAMLSKDLFSVLINTVYFKAAWQNQFIPQSTYRSVFTDRNGKETETDFMLDVSYYDCYCRKKIYFGT